MINASLTNAEHGLMLLSQAFGEAFARAWRHSLRQVRAVTQHLVHMLDRAQQLAWDRIYARRLAVRGMFLTEPRNSHSEYTPAGRMVLAYWARHAHAFAPVQTTDPIALAKAEGKRELFALIISDIFDDLPNFARLMAQEEERQAQEIVCA